MFGFRRAKGLVVLAASVLTAGIFITSAPAGGNGNPNPGVAPPQSKAHGASYGEWSARWCQWALSFPLDQSPPAQDGAVDVSQGQSGSVWFLAGTFGGNATRSCTIPTGKALLFPIVTY